MRLIFPADLLAQMIAVQTTTVRWRGFLSCRFVLLLLLWVFTPFVNGEALPSRGGAMAALPIVPEGEAYDKVRPLLDKISRASPVDAIAFSPDGRTLASGSVDKTVRLWDLATGQERARFDGHQGPVWSVAFSPDGRTLASAGLLDQTVRLWDLATGQERARLNGHQGSVRSVAFSPDGRTLASGSDDPTVRLWDLATGQERARLDGHQGSVTSVAFSPDGRTLASGSVDKTVRLWDLATGQEHARLEGHQNVVTSVAFSPDGRTLASGSVDQSVRLWDLATGQERARLDGHQAPVWSVAFSPDGRTLASGSDDQTVRLWDLATGQERARLEGHQDPVRSVAFSPDGRTLASAGLLDQTVRLWDLATGQERTRLEGHQNAVTSVAFSPDGRTLASGSKDQTVRLWDLATGKERARLEGHQESVTSVAFSPDGRILASGSYRTVRLWDLATGMARADLEGHQSFVWSVAFSPDGRTLASGSDDQTVRLWDLATGQERARLNGHQRSVRSVAFSPNGRTLASGSDDQTVRLWDLATGQERARLDGHQGSVTSVAFSPDGRTLASGSDDQTVRLWDLATGQERTRLEGHQDPVRSVAFSPDGRTLASGSVDQTVRLWDLATGKERARLNGHQRSVRSVAFSPDGRTLASGSTTIRLTTPGGPKKSGRESLIIAPAHHGLWVSCHSAQKLCWRNDDGSLIVDVDAGGRISPLKPAGESQALQAAWELSKSSKSTAGEVFDLAVRVTNSGQGRAYWLRPLQVEAASDWFLEAAVLPMLEPGATALIPVRIHAHSSPVNPKSLTFHPAIVIAQAYGEPVPVPNTPSLLSEPPVLRVVEARRLESKDQQAINLVLANGGSALAKTEFRLDVAGLKTAQQPAVLTQESLPAGGQVNLSFGLPGDLKPEGEQKVALYGRKLFSGEGTGLPLLDWEFRDIPVAPPGPAWTLLLAAALVSLMLLGSVYFQMAYRHPAVVKLRKNPAELVRFDPGELAALGDLIRRGRSLDAVLQTTQIHRGWFDQAVKFAAQTSPKDRCRAFTARLNRSASPMSNSASDLWSLELGENFPLNLQRIVLCLPRREEGAADVFNRLGAPSEVSLVIGANLKQREKLAKLAQSRSGGLLIVPDGAELTGVLLAADPVTELARLIARHVPVTQVSPYQTGAGVHKQNLFFGRRSLLAQITGGSPANYLVVGGRQVGKSSLLKELERRYRDDPSVRCRYLVLSGKDGIGRLAESLGLPPGSDLAAVLDSLHGTTVSRSLFLIDEADAFVDEDRRQGYATLQQLRALSEEGRAYFILAGFWSLYQHAALDYQSPLKNFGAVLTVGPLEPEACRALASAPMATLGICWETDELVTRLIEQTGQRANLISIACDEALWALDSTERILDHRHLLKALDSNRMRDALQGWADLSGDANDNLLDRIVIYATVGLEAPFTLADVIQLLDQRGAQPGPEPLKRSISRLELAFVLGRAANRYFYRVPLQRQLILAEDTELLLRQELRVAQTTCPWPAPS